MSMDDDFSENDECSDNEADADESAAKSGASSGLADVMAKIVGKKVKTSKSVILAKCQTDKERAKRKRTEDETEKSEQPQLVKSRPHETQREIVLKRKRWEELARVKPNVLDKERERNLQRIATKGVVQLFNAIHKQQSLLEDKLKEAGPLESRREKAVQSMTKGKFLDMLKTVKPEDNAAAGSVTEIKVEPPDVDTRADESSTWSILRDDFMMGAKMKDWDKRTDNNDNDENSD